MSSRVALRWVSLTATLLLCALASAPTVHAQRLDSIPQVAPGPQRLITLDDVARLRAIDSLSISPDGSRFSVLVHQGDPATNAYVGGWFVGDTRTGALRFAGDAGAIRYEVMPSGHIVGEVRGATSVWSPDGESFAYLREQDGEVQVWRSCARDGRQQRMSHNAANVRALAWSADGRLLFYSVGDTRDDVSRTAQARERAGYNYDTDITSYSDFLLPQLRPDPPRTTTVWTIDVARRRERPATAEEAAEFQQRIAPAQARNAAGARVGVHQPVPGPFDMQLAVTGADGSETLCTAQECTGHIAGNWWSADGARVYFWRREGINYMGYGFYAWTPGAAAVEPLARFRDDDLRLCQLAAGARFICTRETPNAPAHLAAIDIATGEVTLLADINPEFRNIRLGAIERIEWDTPRFAWQAEGRPLANTYPTRAYGFILYPPDFDPTKTYPVFIDPYVANGFNRHGSEHALHVYAANGFIVLDLAFPIADPAGFHGDFMQHLYNAADEYPHLSMLALSTEAGLDAAAQREHAIDLTRVGIGGYSHGTFVPLYLMKLRDRITTISISSATWGPHEYYSSSPANDRATRAVLGAEYRDWRLDPATSEGRAFWSGFDIADHVDELEGPVLVNAAGNEMFALVRLLRYMSDANHPYDAYVFTDETHIKWQPAHLNAIMARNLDWFRFWLEDTEDPDPAKAAQYEHWRQLRELQCQNRRSLRNYCGVVSR